jgi:DNA-binding response OmpR family regulator
VHAVADLSGAGRACADGAGGVAVLPARWLTDPAPGLRQFAAQRVRTLVVGAEQALGSAQLLEAGADDCARPGAGPAELWARVHALLRRPPPGVVRPLLALADVCLDVEGRRASVAGRDLALPPQELRLLQALLVTPLRPVPRLALCKLLWGREERPGELKVLAYRLRRRLEEGGAGAAVRAVRGVGYVLVEDRAAAE